MALATGQSFREIIEYWEPEDTATALELWREWNKSPNEGQAFGG